MTPPSRRQFFQFLMFKVDPQWRGLDAAQRNLGKSVFAEVLQEWSSRIVIRTYSLTGIRGDVDFFLWLIADRLEDFQALRTQLFRTPLAPYLSTPFSYVSATKRSLYVDKLEDIQGEVPPNVLVPGKNRYLFVYPFVKTRPWYLLPLADRQTMMDEHIRVGRKYPDIRINTTYSFGLDDQEFVVAFEGDDPLRFLDLVMELRETQASLYTLRDTPTFTGIAVTASQMLDALGGSSPVEASVSEPWGEGDDAGLESSPFVPVCPEEAVPTLGGKLVVVRGEQIALFRSGGTIHAISNRCSHSRGPLVDGSVCEGVLTCPWHGAKFDLETGKDHGLPARGGVPVYEVKVEEGWVKVGPVKDLPA